ncbi:DUF4249 family protein [Sanyastnella coralliicola]|uniref:DUF4249 family protein n=1 Tax=Sanyastnella coralliicola TaxID=3069118 RepID=UPI0027BA3796|nr:DUF4249 family protein [Longitalea sp. SCSIO 12813]
MRRNLNILVLFSLATLFFLASCEKEIEVDLPAATPRMVVEGSIEQGQPPIVFLTMSQAYFDPIDLNAYQELIVRDADVYVTSNGNQVQLDLICSSDVPEELLPAVSELTGFTEEELALIDICLYTTFDESIWGVPGNTYDLRIERGEDLLTSRTKINTPIALDSAWFRIPGNPDPDDSLGFAFAILTDPDTLGNAYRWFARRVNTYPAWSENAGEVKDANYIAPLGSATDDAFFNGLSFEFGYFRGTAPGSNKEDDFNAEAGYFKVGDTIAIRGTVIDRGAFDYIISFEDQVATQGSPFASPANIRTNIEGGLGAWIGYGASYDTIICAAP